MRRIIVSVSNDLVTDQRVQKVCRTLTEQGDEVLLLGRLRKNSLQINFDFPNKRMRLVFNRGPLFYAELNFRLFLLLLFTKSDILLSNDLDTLLANFLVSKIKRIPLVYDSHEYFTEVPELKNRWSRKVWLKLESWIFPKLKNVYTVGEELAKVYSKKYGVKVDVVRNVPFQSIQDKGGNNYLLYQGAVNLGRGLIELITAIKQSDYQLKIVGNGDIVQDLKNKIAELNLEDRVELVGAIPPEKLKKYTREASMGFNLLDGDSLNYKYSLANKFFDYIQSEIPVISMNFPEYANIFKRFTVGALIDDIQPKTILNAIKEVEEKRNSINSDIALARQEFIWEKEQLKLKNIFANLE